MEKTSKTGIYYYPLKNGDKTYFFTYKDINDGNKQKRQKVGKYSEGFREINAVNARNEQISKMKHGEDITIIAKKKKKAIVTFDELAQKYFTDKRSTQNRMSRYNIHIKEEIGNKDIRNIDKATINKLLDDVEAQGKAPQTLKSIKELISTIWNHHIKEYDLDITNPCKGARIIKVDNERERYLTLDEVNLLKENFKDDFLVSLFIALSLQTGGRFETILSIQKKDINIAHNTVTLKNLKTQKTYTGYLQKDFIDSIREYLLTLNINDYVVSFENEHDKKLTQRNLQHRLKPVLDKLFNKGLDTRDTKNRVVIHTFRHTFASHLAINGTPIFTVMKLMNHAKIEQTIRYAKLSPDSGREAVKGLYR